MMKFKFCVVSNCKSNSLKTPEKLFIKLPDEIVMRSTWLQLARRNPELLSKKKDLHLCEDHFDLEFDMMNYTQYKSKGSENMDIKMRPNVVPTKFDCIGQPTLDSSKVQFHMDLIKTETLAIIKEAEAGGIEPSHTSDEDELENKPQISNTINGITNGDAFEITPLTSNDLNNVAFVNDDTKTLDCKDNNETGMSATEENILVESDPSKHVCRTCLQSVEALSLFNLFQAWSPVWEGMENTIAEDLAKLTNIEVCESDNHSKYICESCCVKLHTACSFVSQVKKNDKLLNLKYLKHEEDLIDKSWPKPIQIDKSLVCDNGKDVEIKKEVLSDEEYNCNLEDGYREHNIVEVKVEPEEIVEPAPIQITVNGSLITEFEKNQFHKLEAIKNGEENMQVLDTYIKEEIPSEPEDTESSPNDLPLECMLCMKTFNSMSGLKAHVIAHHSYKSVKRKTGDTPRKTQKSRYPCTICKRTFTTSTDLMVHETCHNKDVCYGCNAKFDSFELLAEHRERCKAISSAEVKRPKMLDDVVRVNNKKKERQQRYREQKRAKLKQREAKRRKCSSKNPSKKPSTSNINRIGLNNEEIIAAVSQSSSGLEGTQTSSIQRNAQAKSKNYLQKRRQIQQRYREQNREKLKQRETERRKLRKHLKSIKGPSTSSNINRIGLNNEEIVADISQSSSGLEGTQTSSIQTNEQAKKKSYIQRRRESQQRYKERNREKLRQREAERRKRIKYLKTIGEPSTSSNIKRIELNNEVIKSAIYIQNYLPKKKEKINQK